jgi:DNA repair protein RecO (recombination protein O)
MAHKKDEVFIIKSLDYSEADKILTLFGRSRGRFTVIAKGIRKINSKNRGNMQTLSLSRIGYFDGRNMGILRDSELILPFDSSITAIKVAERVLFLLNKMLVDDQVEPEVFDAVEKLLSNEVNDANLNKFRFAVLSKMGFLPNSKECILTGSNEDLNYFDPKTLGVVSQKAMDEGVVKINDLWVKSELDYGESRVTDVLDRYIKGVVG